MRIYSKIFSDLVLRAAQNYYRKAIFGDILFDMSSYKKNNSAIYGCHVNPVWKGSSPKWDNYLLTLTDRHFKQG